MKYRIVVREGFWQWQYFFHFYSDSYDYGNSNTDMSSGGKGFRPVRIAKRPRDSCLGSARSCVLSACYRSQSFRICRTSRISAGARIHADTNGLRHGAFSNLASQIHGILAAEFFPGYIRIQRLLAFARGCLIGAHDNSSSSSR